MLLNFIGALLLGLGLAIIWIVYRLLRKEDWFRGWLRGNLALLLLAIVFTMAFGAMDVMSYTPLKPGVLPVAEIDIRAVDEQVYELSMVLPDQSPQKFEIRGDMWQLDCKILAWTKAAQWLGLRPAFRLDRISGRYYTLEQETQAARTVYSLEPKEAPIDMWSLSRRQSWLPLIEARQGAGVYLPMHDGAKFKVLMKSTGLIAQPANDIAQRAMVTWQ